MIFTRAKFLGGAIFELRVVKSYGERARLWREHQSEHQSEPHILRDHFKHLHSKLDSAYFT